MTKYGVFLQWLASLLYEISFSVILYLQVKGEKLYEQSQKPPIDQCRKTNTERQMTKFTTCSGYKLRKIGMEETYS